MPTIKLKHSELAAEVAGRVSRFPKYATQIINLANQNAQGTRPKVVGQMTELFREFGGKTFEEWEIWYTHRKPTAIDDATERVYDMVEKLRDAIQQIDKEMVKQWVADLVLAKTFVGLCFQEAILSKIANLKGVTYRVSTPLEESRGIDGYIGETPVSIKPSTYSAKSMLGETIEVRIILYEKKKDGISFTYDF
jgi:uncharacterized protein YukE